MDDDVFMALSVFHVSPVMTFTLMINKINFL